MNKEDKKSITNEQLDGMLASINEGKKLTGGDAAACRAYLQSNERGFDRIVIELPPSTGEDFADMLRVFEAAGITEFVLADPSTGLMLRLHMLIDAGYTITGAFSHKIDDYHIIKGLVIRKK